MRSITVWAQELPGPRSLWNAIGLVIRLGLAAVFAVSGILKAADPAQTRVAVDAYQLLPDGVAEVVAMLLPYLEIAAAVLLLLGLATRLGAVLSALMMLAFIIGVSQAAARGLSIDCGCFGGGGSVQTGATEYTLEILRDVGLLILSLYLLIRPQSWASVDGLASRSRGEVDGGYDDEADTGGDHVPDVDSATGIGR